MTTKTDDELLSLWTGAGGAFASDPAAQTAMMPREQMLAFLRSLIDGGSKAPVNVLRDPSLVTDEMLLCELEERGIDDFKCWCSDGAITGYDEVEAEAMYYAMHRGEMGRVREYICKLAGKIA